MSGESTPAKVSAFQIYEKVRDLAPEQRNLYLDKVCKGNPELRTKIEKLLGVQLTNNSMEKLLPTMVQPGVGTDSEPDKIGDYRIIEKLGQGTFGTVYSAKKSRGLLLGKKFAIKVLNGSVATENVINRFRLEQEALLLLEANPYIATIFEADKTADGKPYFVMGLVKGIEITHFANEYRLSIEERIRLFLKVCNAVQYAHENKIIHRDIKASNVLVTKVGNEYIPKVIDFGISKITGSDKHFTCGTRPGTPMGTWSYMSPEQAIGEEVDERTDIYALGVLLYELLTGVQPIKIDELTEEKISQAICMVKPLAPSVAIQRLDDEQRARFAKDRCLLVNRVGECLPKAIDEVVLQCIAKTPDERFRSVADLAKSITDTREQRFKTAGNFGMSLGTFVLRRKWVWGGSMGVLFLTLVVFVSVVFQSRNINVHAPDSAHAEAAKRIFWIFKVLKSSDHDISVEEQYLTPNAKVFWRWLLAQNWFEKKPIPRITGYDGDSLNPVVNIVFEYPTSYEQGNETMGVKFVCDHGVYKLDEVNLLEMKGARFNGMPLSLVVTNRAEADRQFAILNPQIQGGVLLQFAKQ